MGKAMRTYNIPRRKLVLMTKCYRVVCDQEDYDAGSGVAMHGDLADQSKDYVNQWGTYCAVSFCGPYFLANVLPRPFQSGYLQCSRSIARKTRHDVHRRPADPPLRPYRFTRGDNGRTSRFSKGRQGALLGCELHVDVSVCHPTAHRGEAWVHQVRGHAEPLQLTLSRRGARDEPVLQADRGGANTGGYYTV